MFPITSCLQGRDSAAKHKLLGSELGQNGNWNLSDIWIIKATILILTSGFKWPNLKLTAHRVAWREKAARITKTLKPCGRRKASVNWGSAALELQQCFLSDELHIPTPRVAGAWVQGWVLSWRRWLRRSWGSSTMACGTVGSSVSLPFHWASAMETTTVGEKWQHRLGEGTTKTGKVYIKSPHHMNPRNPHWSSDPTVMF